MNLLEQIATYLQDDLSLGTLGTDIFYSFVPDDSLVGDDIIVVLDTGGVEPDHYVPTKTPTFQVFIRNSDYDSGKAILESVRALHQKYGELVSGQDYFLNLHLLAEGGHLGRDEKGRDTFSINFVATTRASS